MLGGACAGWPFARVERAELVVEGAGDAGRSEREILASRPDRASALGRLRWNGGDEADAARFLSALAAVRHVHRDHRAARAPLRRRLEQVWDDHPEFTTASRCTWCGFDSSVIDARLAGREIDPEWAAELGAAHPKRLAQLAGLLSDERRGAIALVHAELLSAGDAASARLVAAALIEGGHEAALLAWVSKGLNGGRALDAIRDLGTLPQPIVEAAWENGVRGAYHSPRLTEYLLGRGHRAALRWVLWVLDPSASYLGGGYGASQQFERTSYPAIAERHLSFLIREDATPAEVYSERWRDVFWDATSRRWQLRGDDDQPSTQSSTDRLRGRRLTPGRAEGEAAPAARRY